MWLTVEAAHRRDGSWERGADPPGVVQCRLQYLEDGDPFCCASFPEPRRPPSSPVAEALPLAAQVPAFLRLLGAPLRLEDCALQVLPSGYYLDLELSLLEQKDDLEAFYEDISKGRRPILLLRTQLSVRVHAIIEKLYCSKGPELRRSLFSLKQLFQEDKDLVPEFVNSEGLTCLVSVGAEADQNYQNYILRALSQIMLFVDGMMGVIQHPETLQWLYALTGSLYRLVVKTALKLLLVFVEFTESNAQLLIQAVGAVEQVRGGFPWSRLVAILEQKSGADTELQVFAMTLINKTLAALPDQDSFYDVTDCLEQQGMERLVQAHLASKGTDSDLRQQLALYEVRTHGGRPPRCLPACACWLADRLSDSQNALKEEDGMTSKSSRLALSAGRNGDSVPHAVVWSVLFSCRARFLENLAASQKEKISAISRGRAEILAEAASNTEPVGPGRVQEAELVPSLALFSSARPFPRWSEGQNGALNWEEPSSEPALDHQESREGVSPKEALKIQDLDFSDLCEEEDLDVHEAKVAKTTPPPPPGIPGPPPPPPLSSPLLGGEASSPAKKKKTVKLFWKELKDVDGPARESRFGQATLWASLEKVTVDSARLEHLFESRAKEAPSSKKAVDGRKLIVVLDPKRSNAINIGLTVLPPIHVIKTAILGFDEFAINKEGIEKILTMVPTEEEKRKIQEAQLANPNLPLGSAEQFLLTLSSIAELPARLQLWTFKLDYEALEKEIVEPLFDLKLGMEQLANNQTFRCILATLLAMGNLLNGSQSRGFELSYLAKVSEVKDTVHRQSLLHHLCHFVVVEFPATTDLYSEIAALTRCAKVDFEELAESLLQLEQRCKASWEHLKAIAKHDCKPALKSKLLGFLQASTEKIGLLKIVHRRVLNRFRSFLLFLGYDTHSAQNMRVTSFCRLLREFALEYHTCRERVLQQQKKRAACRERNKTRGRMITEVRVTQGGSKVLSASPEQKDEASHKDMTSLLVSPAEGPGHRSRASRGRTMSATAPTPQECPHLGAGKPSPAGGSTPQEEAAGSPEDASEEIMNRLVKSVTQRSPARSGPAKERRRSRGNRKSLRRTLKSGLSEELVQALGLAQSASVAV
uniref:Formin homology 2 domain containing 1 n=1 Tax=Pseudonaja textilis TaxID=8673 RepID=A0A670YDW2_PSETE